MHSSRKHIKKIPQYSKRHKNRLLKENTNKYLFENESLDIDKCAVDSNSSQSDKGAMIDVQTDEVYQAPTCSADTMAENIDIRDEIQNTAVNYNADLNLSQNIQESAVKLDDLLSPILNCRDEEVPEFKESDDALSGIMISNFQKLKLTETYEMFLKDWATEHKGLTQHALSTLLAGMKKVFSPLTGNFNIDSRTLMKHRWGPPSDNIVDIASGQYCHFGSYDHICMALKDGFKTRHPCVDFEKKTFQLSLFVDGLKIHKSTFKNFWVILGSVPGANNDVPFCIGLYYSVKHHPSSFVDFLSRLINDLEQLRGKQFTVENVNYTFSYDGPIICDMPAKSDVKNIKGHSGFFSCDKCVARGRHNTKVHFPFNEKFPKFHGELAFKVLRTNENFRDKSFPKHHRCILINSAFEEIADVDMILNFVIDYMHNMCLGVMKQLLKTWLVTTNTERLSSGLIESLEKKSANLRDDCPSEFINKVRDFSLLSQFKAKEFRAILGYWGIAIMRDYLPRDTYNHFLLFACAFRILASNLAYEEEYISYAENLLIRFVKDFAEVYEEKNIVSNVHRLLHIANDVRRYGPLDNFSAFKFESYLSPMKNLIHGSQKPLEQVFNKLMIYKDAQKNIVKPKKKNSHECEFWYPLKKGGKLNQDKDDMKFRKIKYHNFSITTEHPNNVVVLENGHIIVVEKIVKGGLNDGFIFGRKFRKIENLFEAPMPSSQLDIYMVSLPLTRKVHRYKASLVKFKCICTKVGKKKCAILPLLHTS
jgi:hypothetical protein